MGTKGVEEPLIIFTTGSGIATGVNSFQLTGSVVVQPTPYVSISRENIHNGKRHGARDTITLDGQLTGYTCPDRTNNFDYLTSFQDQLIQKFQENQYGWLRVRENSGEVFSAPNCRVQSINFRESKLYNLVDYTISLESYPSQALDSSSYAHFGVINPVDTWNFSESAGKVSLTHEISAKGFNRFKNGAGKADAILNARNFVHSRTGLSHSYVAPTFVVNGINNASPDPVLLNRSEIQNPIEGTYSITENYEFNRDGERNAPIVTTSCNIQSGINQDFASVDLNVQVQGGWTGIHSGSANAPDGATTYGNHSPTELTDYVTGILTQNLVNKAKALSNINDLNSKPVSYSAREDFNANLVEINVSYDNNQLFQTISNGSTTIAKDYAYFDYSLSTNRDVISNTSKYTIVGNIVGRGHLKDKYHNAVTFLENDMTPNITGYLYALANDYHTKQDAVTRESLNPTPTTVSIDKNSIEGSISIRGEFNDLEEATVTLSEESYKVSDYLEDIVWNWEVTPSLPHYSTTPSNNLAGVYMVYDAGIMKRIRFQLSLDCRAKKCVNFQDAVRIAEKYANYLTMAHIDQESYVDKSASSNQNPTDGTIRVSLNGTCKKHSKHNIIDKDKTKIIGDYVN